MKRFFSLLTLLVMIVTTGGMYMRGMCIRCRMILKLNSLLLVFLQ